MKLFGFLAVFCFAAFLSGCAFTPKYFNSDTGYREFAGLVKAANLPAVCSYKGKVVVSIDSFGNSGSFSGILDKTCGDELRLSIFGPLNSIFAQIEYKNSEVTVKAADKSSEGDIKAFAYVAIEGIISYLRYPLYMPEEDGRIDFKDGFYVYDGGYDKDNALIYFDKDFRVARYIIGEKNPVMVYYSFSGKGAVAEIKVEQGGNKVSVKLLNPLGWGVPND